MEQSRSYLTPMGDQLLDYCWPCLLQGPGYPSQCGEASLIAAAEMPEVGGSSLRTWRMQNWYQVLNQAIILAKIKDWKGKT
jgi:hypothetical protein